MVDQTSVNGRGTAGVPGSSTAEFDGVAEFVDDLASLAELQAKLAALDFRDSARKSAVPVVLTMVGLAVIVASLPVALLGTAWLLATALKIHQGWAMLLTAGVAIALGGSVAVLAGRRLSHSFESFRRSHKQLCAEPGMGSDGTGHQRQRSPASAAACVTLIDCRTEARIPRSLMKLNQYSPREPESNRPIPQQGVNDHGDQRADVRGEWTYLCGLARRRWSQLTEDDLRVQEENIEKLIGRIQQKTGEGREAIENFFSDATSRGSSGGCCSVTGRRPVRPPGERPIRERYGNAESLVRRHPVETVVAAFGIGLVAGLIAGLAMRAR